MKDRTETPFDCIAFKREAQAAIYEAIGDLSIEEQIAWFRQAAESGPLREWYSAIGRRSARTTR